MKNQMAFAGVLLVLDRLDKSLPHHPGAEWPGDVALRRNTMVWQVARQAIDNGYVAVVTDAEEFPIVYIELPTGQVSWHVPTNEQPEGISIPVCADHRWDNHTREEKTERIHQYAYGKPKPVYAKEGVKTVPLRYNGVTVGAAEVEFDEKGANVKAHIYHPDVANKILGAPKLGAVSYGFDNGGIDFSGVIPGATLDALNQGKYRVPKDNAIKWLQKGEHSVMLNPTYAIARCRDLLNEFEPSRERSLAATKLDECELWLTRCTPTKEAQERDGSSEQ